MSTKITEKITINAAGKDIIIDGVDFTENGYVEVNNAASITIRNCRVYGMNVDGTSKNYWLRIYGDILTKLIISGCFFGESVGSTGQMYNLLEPTAKLADGSSFSGNYFEDGCCTHNTINIYGADDNSNIYVNGNRFEVSAGTIRIGVKGEPSCSIHLNNNHVDSDNPNEPDDYQGIVMIQPYGKQTTSFANMSIYMNNNHSANEQVVYGYSGANDTMLDESTMPTIMLDGEDITNDVVIYH